MQTRKPRRKKTRLHPAVYSQPGAVGLLTTCTAARRKVFFDPTFAEAATTEINQLHGETWSVLGFCVMPDHVHLLVLNVDGSLLDFMRVFKGRTAKRIRPDVPGTLWQRSFHDHLLRRKEDINRTLQYMLENPVRAGLVEEWARYPWCGSCQWPEIDPDFFSVRPEDVLWTEVFQLAPSPVDDG
ncbi:MAG: transposase [Acidobacteria bacterium]|nr:transposase [Acidobacteriota bacterium]